LINRRQEPHLVIRVRENELREELVGDDLVIVLLPLSTSEGVAGSGSREPLRPHPKQGSTAEKAEPSAGEAPSDAVAPLA